MPKWVAYFVVDLVLCWQKNGVEVLKNIMKSWSCGVVELNSELNRQIS